MLTKNPPTPAHRTPLRRLRAGGFAAGQDADENIAIGGEFFGRSEIWIGDVGLPAASAVDDLQPEGFGAARDRLADSAVAQNAERLVSKGRRHAERLARLPLAGPQIAFGRRKPPHAVDDEREGGVGRIFGYGMRRVRHADSVRRRIADVDVLVASAHGRHVFEARQAPHEGAGQRPSEGCPDQSAHAVRDFVGQGVLDAAETMHGANGADRLRQLRRQGGRHQQFEIAHPQTLAEVDPSASFAPAVANACSTASTSRTAPREADVAVSA